MRMMKLIVKTVNPQIPNAHFRFVIRQVMVVRGAHPMEVAAVDAAAVHAAIVDIRRKFNELLSQ